MESAVGGWFRGLVVATAVVASGGVAGALPPPTHASPEDLARAEALFQAGKKLLDAGNAAAACPKLAESLRLDPGGGTLIALALCHLAEGKTASAWGELGDALALAQRDGRRDREDFVRARLAEVSPRLSRLALDVGRDDGAVAGVELRRDGAAIQRAEWGVPVPLDPGAHVVTLSAPGRATVTRTVSIGKDGDLQRLVIVFGNDAPPPAASSGPPIASASAPAPPDPVPPRVGSDSRRTVALVAGGVGVVGLAIGTIFGVRALGAWSDAKQACPARECSDRQGVARRDDASAAATIADVGFGAAIVGLGVATYLLVEGASSSPSASRVWLAPIVGDGGGGLLAKGRW